MAGSQPSANMYKNVYNYENVDAAQIGYVDELQEKYPDITVHPVRFQTIVGQVIVTMLGGAFTPAKSPESPREGAQQLAVDGHGFSQITSNNEYAGSNGKGIGTRSSMPQRQGPTARLSAMLTDASTGNSTSMVDDVADGTTTDPSFSWELYLAELNATPVALQAFPHVERAFRELVPKDSVIEVVWHREGDAERPSTLTEAAGSSDVKQEICYFWYARVVVSSAPLLLVRWLGSSQNDVCSEFWVDCEEGNVHSVGWHKEFRLDAPSASGTGPDKRINSRLYVSRNRDKTHYADTTVDDKSGITAGLNAATVTNADLPNSQSMQYEMRMPPEVLNQLRAAATLMSTQPFEDSTVTDAYRAEAWSAPTPRPEDIEDHHGIPPAERIIPGNYVDLLSEEEPTCAWPVKILDSAGGRLKLHYWPVGDELIEQQYPSLKDGKTPQQFAEECEEDEFWVFCNSYLIRPLGSTGRYRIPDDLPECYRELLRNLSGTWHAGLKELVEREQQHKLSPDIFSYFEPEKNHNFQAGMRLESLNPINEKHIQPAYIGRVFDNGYVHLVYDDMEKYEWVEEDARERQRALREGRAGCMHASKCELHGCTTPKINPECPPECAALNAAAKNEAKKADKTGDGSTSRLGNVSSSEFSDNDVAGTLSPSARGPPLHTSVTKASLRILTFQNSTRMLPPYWSERNGVKLSKPSKWSTTRHGEFSWPRMIDGFGGQLAARSNFKFVEQLITNPGFYVGAKLEAVNPEAPDEICTATIVRVIPPMLWIHIDSYGQSLTYMTPFDSTDIFPCGFCSMHNVKLHLPRIMMHGRRSAFMRSSSNANLALTAASSSTKSNKSPNPLIEVNQIVPRPVLWRDIPIITLYYNRGCSIGPFLIGKRMHTLHLQIGPGPLRYVLREFIRMLVNCHRSPPAALRMMAELGNNTTTTPDAVTATTSTTDSNAAPSNVPTTATNINNNNNSEPSRREKIPAGMLFREKVLVKAKMKPRSETRAVPIVSQVWLVPDFVRQICILFQACPSLYTIEKRPSDAECKESCDSFVRPNPRAVAYRRAARRPVGGTTSTTATAGSASGTANNSNSNGVGNRRQRQDNTGKTADDAADDAADNDADGDAAEAGAGASGSQQQDQQPEAPTTRSTRNRAKVSYQLMDKGISGDARQQKFESSYENAPGARRAPPKDATATAASGKRKRLAEGDDDTDTNPSSIDDGEDDGNAVGKKRGRTDADDADYDQTLDGEHDDDDEAEENSTLHSDDDNTEEDAVRRSQRRAVAATKQTRATIQTKMSGDSSMLKANGSAKAGAKPNVLSPRTPIGTPTKNAAADAQQRKVRGGKRGHNNNKGGRPPVTLAERNERAFLRELSALASNNQQIPLSQRRRVAEAAAASGKSFRSTVSQVGAGQYYDDNRAQAWMEFWTQCDYLDKAYVDKVRAKDPRLWTCQDVESFLIGNYGQQVADIFTTDGIDGDLLMRLDMLGLRTLRVPSNVIPELMLEIEKLKVAFMYCHGDELTPDEWCTLTEHCGGQMYED